jgi:Leucine-rich repeat (LRR) protein
MDAIFAQIQEGFEKLGRDISVAVDKLGSDYNRANGALKRAETARKTGIVTERNASLSAFPEYVCELGEAAKVVDVSGNTITALPQALARLTRVHRLCASHNALFAVPPGLCAGWVSLKVLRLEGNKLASLPPDLGELARLEELWLSDNEIVSLPASVAKLVRLRRLRLARNRLRFDPDEKSPATDDESTFTSLRFLGSCAAARELALDGNPGIARVPSSFGALANLETLSLDDTRVRAVPPELFEGCAALRSLSLKNTPAAEDPAALRATRGFGAFDARRARSRDKQIAGNVLVSGMDDIVGTNPRKR